MTACDDEGQPAPGVAETDYGPKKIQNDEGMVEEFGIEEQIKADLYDKSSCAVKPPFGMRIAHAKNFGAPQ